MKTKWVQVVLKLPADHAQALTRAALEAGFATRSQFIWHLYAARRMSIKLGDAEKAILRELVIYRNFRGKPTPTSEELARVISYSPKVVAKAIEGLEVNGLVKVMLSLDGPYANDVICGGRRLRITPLGEEVAYTL